MSLAPPSSLGLTSSRLRVALPRHAPGLAGLALAIPTLVAFYPPMNDLPMHEGVVGILRHFGDTSYFPPHLYRLNLGHPNQLFYALAWLCSLLVSTSLACKLVIAASQIAIMSSAGRLAAHLGRSPWGSLLVAPLALGFTYYWGLVTNLVGFAAFLFALPALDEAALVPSARGAVKSCGLLLLVYLAHESLFVAAAGIVAAYAVLPKRPARATLLALAPAGFAVALAVGHQLWAASMFTTVIPSTSPTRFLPWTEKLRSVPIVLFGSHDASALWMLLGLAVTGVIALVVGRIREPSTEAIAPDVGLRARCLRLRFELVGVGFLAAYFLAPFSWRGATLIHERFLGPGWALLVIAAAPRATVSLVGKLASSVLAIAILLLAWPQFADASETFQDLQALIGRIPRGAAVASSAFTTPTPNRIFSPNLGPARTVAVVGGRAGLSLAVSPISPVQLAPENRWDEYEARTLLASGRGLVPAHDLTRFGFLLIKANDRSTQRLLVGALAPDADLVAVRGDWILFASKHEVAALTAPATIPPPGFESLWARVVFLAEEAHAPP